MRRIKVAVILGTLCLAGPSGSALAQTPTYYLDNGYVRVGVDADWGGAITYLGFSSINFNWVNNGNPDPGRSIQASVYTTGQPYATFGCGTSNWGWNPVQGGNVCNQGSGLLSATATGSYIYTKTQPLNWDDRYGRSNVTIEQTVSQPAPYVVQVSYTITNNESFAFSWGRHELPVAYLDRMFWHPVAYNGPAPFTYDPNVTEYYVPRGGSDGPISTTEPWVAWLSDDGAGGYSSGLGICLPGKYDNWNHGWVTGGTDSSQVQAWGNYTVSPGQQLSVNAYLLLGLVNGIQQSAYQFCR